MDKTVQVHNMLLDLANTNVWKETKMSNFKSFMWNVYGKLPHFPFSTRHKLLSFL